jgi:8-oxo-dGTP diphosphatase
MSDIYKAAGILIHDRRFLVNRKEGRSVFISPGGRLEVGETAAEALIRELKEELTIDVAAQDLEKFGTFSAEAVDEPEPGTRIHMEVFLVKKWEGEIKAADNITDVLWIDSRALAGVQLGSIFEHDVLPRLKEKNLIN